MATKAQIEAEVLRIVEDHNPALVDSAVIVTHIARAQRAIEMRCAFAVQKASVTFQVLPATANFAKPDNYLGVRKAPRFLEQTSSTRPRKLLEVEDATDYGLTTEQGRPRYWIDDDEDTISFWPIGDDEGPSIVTPGAYDVVVPYWKSLAALSAAADTNWWSENLDDVLAWRAVAFIFAEGRDPLANWWSSVAAARFIEFKNQYKRNKLRSRATQLYPTEVISGGTNRERQFTRRTWIAEIL